MPCLSNSRAQWAPSGWNIARVAGCTLTRQALPSGQCSWANPLLAPGTRPTKHPLTARALPCVRSHGTLAMIMDNLGIFAKIIVSLCTILNGHGIFAKIMARSWQGQQGTYHGSWQAYHGFEHWL